MIPLSVLYCSAYIPCPAVACSWPVAVKSVTVKDSHTLDYAYGATLVKGEDQPVALAMD